MLKLELVEAVLARALKGGADVTEVDAQRAKKRRMKGRQGALEEALAGLD